jgi:hypothetical protein
MTVTSGTASGGSEGRDRGIDFLLVDHGPAGILLDVPVPREPGRWKYMPYRSVWHYELGQRLRAGETPRCVFEADGARVEFTVASIPEYGVLEVTHVQRIVGEGG